MKSHLVVSLAFSLVIGCGGGAEETSHDDDATGGGEETAHHHEGEGEHHEGGEGHREAGPHSHRMSEGLHALHEVLAGPYHMDPGAERATATCGAAAQMADGSGAMDEELEGTPGAAAPAALIAACEAGGDAPDEAAVGAIEAALETVHDVFHAAMEHWRAEHPE